MKLWPCWCRLMPLVGMGATGLNVTGDLVGTSIIARSESRRDT
ncbi:MAG: dicarboxylate/amino acid:cation symporter [Marinobacter sp.]|nr:dicarboxylate/amino acid:cation symporter [Marinobacter sp.]